MQDSVDGGFGTVRITTGPSLDFPSQNITRINRSRNGTRSLPLLMLPMR
jgi:hypothetical protein